MLAHTPRNSTQPLEKLDEMGQALSIGAQMNMMFESILGWVWIVGTIVIAIVLVAAAIVSAVLSAKRKRIGFVGLTAVFLIATAASVLANPIANVVIFRKVTERNGNQMIAHMRTECPIGHDAHDFIAKFGRPARITSLHRSYFFVARE